MPVVGPIAAPLVARLQEWARLLSARFCPPSKAPEAEHSGSSFGAGRSGTGGDGLSRRADGGGAGGRAMGETGRTGARRAGSQGCSPGRRVPSTGPLHIRLHAFSPFPPPFPVVALLPPSLP